MNDKEARVKILAEEPILKAILTMAVPVVLAMLVQVLYNLVDTFFVGMLNDVNQLAASNVGFPFFLIIMATGSVIGVGASSVISRYIGMGKKREAGEIVGLSLFLIVAIGAAFTIFGATAVDHIVALVGARGDVVKPTRAYLLPLILGSAITMGNFALGVMIRSEGAAMQSMTGMMIGSVANIILNPVMIFGLRLGIAGSAWATVIANAFGLLWYLYCYAKKSMLKVSFGAHVFRSSYFREIFSIGVPSGLNQGLMSVASIVTNNLAAAYGATTLGAMGIASKVNSLAILMLIGLSTGCQPLFGYNYGARNRKRIVQTLRTSVILSAAIGAFMLILFTVAGKYIVGVFSPIPEVVSRGTFALRALSASAPIIGVAMIVTNCIQAMGKGVPALILSTGRQGLYYLPLLFALNALFGFNGLIFTQPVVDALMAITAAAMLRFVLRRDEHLNGANSTPVVK